jgi:hypothetical protein
LSQNYEFFGIAGQSSTARKDSVAKHWGKTSPLQRYGIICLDVSSSMKQLFFTFIFGKNVIKHKHYYIYRF